MIIVLCFDGASRRRRNGVSSSLCGKDRGSIRSGIEAFKFYNRIACIEETCVCGASERAISGYLRSSLYADAISRRGHGSNQTWRGTHNRRLHNKCLSFPVTLKTPDDTVTVCLPFARHPRPPKPEHPVNTESRRVPCPFSLTFSTTGSMILPLSGLSALVTFRFPDCFRHGWRQTAWIGGGWNSKRTAQFSLHCS